MGFRINNEDVPETGMPEEGKHVDAVIADATLKRSHAGDQMVNVCIAKDGSKEILVYDNIMLGGKGLGIGLAKLQAIGLAVRDDDGWDVEDVEAWAGQRCFTVHIKHGEFNGRKRAEVDFDAPNFGYEKQEPGNDDERTAPDEDDDIPF